LRGELAEQRTRLVRDGPTVEEVPGEHEHGAVSSRP
jgi:hypothetical protein